MPRTLTAKLIQLSLGTVERDASILSNATQRTLFLSPSKLLFLKGIETNLFELVAEIGRTPIILVTPSITPSLSIVFHGRTRRSDDQARTRATSSVHSTTALHTLLLSFVLLLANKWPPVHAEGVLSLRERDHRSSLIVSRRDTVIAAH